MTWIIALMRRRLVFAPTLPLTSWVTCVLSSSANSELKILSYGLVTTLIQFSELRVEDLVIWVSYNFDSVQRTQSGRSCHMG